MKTGLVVLSRMDSSRLPGKAMKKIGERCLLDWCVSRCQAAKNVDDVFIATTDREIDAPIVDFSNTHNVNVYRGNCDDVLGRIVACAMEFDLENIVRISGDSPFIDPDVIDAVIAFHLEHGADLTSNVFPRTFPPGCSVEVVKASVLSDVASQELESSDREHVTSYLYKHAERFCIKNYINPMGDQSDIHLTLDTVEDFERLNSIATQIDIDTPLTSILALAKQMKESP